MDTEEIIEMQKDKEAKARATILEIVGDIPDADIAPPENVLFVCKLNPVTNDDDLEIIFSRFGKIVGYMLLLFTLHLLHYIKLYNTFHIDHVTFNNYYHSRFSCEVIRDHQTGDSLQYAFIEFADRKSCEEAYFKMDNVLIDDRRIHVDFSQSVAKMRWRGKGKGIRYFDENDQAKKRDENSKDKRKEDRIYNDHHEEDKCDKRRDKKRKVERWDKNSDRRRNRSEDRSEKRSKKNENDRRRDRSEDRSERRNKKEGNSDRRRDHSEDRLERRSRRNEDSDRKRDRSEDKLERKSKRDQHSEHREHRRRDSDRKRPTEEEDDARHRERSHKHKKKR